MATTPTVRLHCLVNELIRLRTEAGVTAAQAAKYLDCQVSKISRIEQKRSNVSVSDVKMLAELYHATPEQTRLLLDLARGQGRRGRWSGYRSVYPEWFRMFVDLEQDAATIRWVQSEIMPGILQTERYMRELHSAPLTTSYGTTGDVEQSVRARRERQAILTKAEPPQVSFVLSESSLRRMVGGPDVMREQLEYLVGMSTLPHVQIQVLPFVTKDQVTDASFNFALLNIPAPGIIAPLEFCYVEQYDDARYLDDKNAVAAYVNLWGHLTAAALGRTDSAEFIRKVAREYQSP